MSTIRLACPQGCWWRDNTRGDEIEGKLPLWRKGGRLNWRCKRGKRAARGWETARWSLWLCFVCPLKSECHRIKLPFKNWFFFFSSSFQGTTEADWITNRWSKLLSSFHRLLHFNGASIYLLFFLCSISFAVRQHGDISLHLSCGKEKPCPLTSFFYIVSILPGITHRGEHLWISHTVL